MMFEKSSPVDDDPQFANDLEEATSVGAGLRRHLPILLLGFAVVLLAAGLHGAGAVVVGAAGVHVVLGVMLLVMAKLRSGRRQ